VCPARGKYNTVEVGCAASEVDPRNGLGAAILSPAVRSRRVQLCAAAEPLTAFLVSEPQRRETILDTSVRHGA
jgi:hypothetical protein